MKISKFQGEIQYDNMNEAQKRKIFREHYANFLVVVVQLIAQFEFGRIILDHVSKENEQGIGRPLEDSERAAYVIFEGQNTIETMETLSDAYDKFIRIAKASNIFQGHFDLLSVNVGQFKL